MSGYNQNSNAGFGLAETIRMHTGILSLGKILVVCPSTDANFDRLTNLVKTDSDGVVRLYTTLAAAYAAATTNQNDVILLQGNSAHAVTTGIAWSKSRIHVLGMDGGDRLVQQGARVVGAAADDTGYVIKVTGTRNSFRNIKFDQGSTDAAGLTVAQFGGEGTLVKNCSFVFSTATNLDGNETTTYEVVMGEDSGTFINCTFGNDTLDTTGARAVMAIDVVTTSQEMKSCIFKDCLWNILSDDANANFIRVLATTDCKFGTTFINPIFHASLNNTTGGIVLTDAVDSVSSLIEGDMFFVNPSTNCTNFSSAITDNLFVTGQNPVAATAGVAVTPA